MIKVEKVLPGSLGFATKEGSRIQLRYGILLSYADYETVEIEAGSIVFSIDETELVTRTAEPVEEVPAANLEEVPAVPAPEEPVEKAPVQPTIVRPAPRSKK